MKPETKDRWAQEPCPRFPSRRNEAAKRSKKAEPLTPSIEKAKRSKKAEPLTPPIEKAKPATPPIKKVKPATPPIEKAKPATPPSEIPERCLKNPCRFCPFRQKKVAEPSKKVPPFVTKRQQLSDLFIKQNRKQGQQFSDLLKKRLASPPAKLPVPLPVPLPTKLPAKL